MAHRHHLMLSAAILAVSFFISGCSVISRQARSQVTYEDSFSNLQQNPGAHEGETVLLGGMVITTRTEGDATEIEVLQLSFDGRQRPTREDLSQGRFLVIVSMPFDPLRFPKETTITVVGRVLGGVVRPIGQMPYRYPLLEAIEYKTWQAEQVRTSPRIHFGIGIGTSF